MITDQDISLIRVRLKELEGQVAFLYKHLGITYIPEPGPDEDPRIIEMVKQGNLLEAIKIHRELNGSSLVEAKMAVDQLKGKLGL